MLILAAVDADFADDDDEDADVDDEDTEADVDDKDAEVDVDDKDIDDLLKGRDFVSLLAGIAFLESGQIPAFQNPLLKWAGQNDCSQSCAIRPENISFVTVVARLDLIPFQNISPWGFHWPKDTHIQRLQEMGGVRWEAE